MQQHNKSGQGADLYFADLAERGRQYDARGSVADFDACVAQYARLAREVNRDCVGLYDLQYGQAAAERLDVFPTVLGKQPAPVFIFIHGGYWRSQAKEDAPIMVKPFTQAGVAVCTLEYTLLPEATLPEVVRQVRSAVAWLYRNGLQYGIDPNRLYVGGSSAGAHLAAMATAQGWASLYGLPEDVVKGLAGLSGLYELAPLCQIAPNEWLQLHADQTARVSPLHHLPRAGLPVVLAVGGLETEGFKNQTTAYEAACRAAGLGVNRVHVPQCNHFDLLCEWADSQSDLSAAVLDMILAA
ncbi:alpha/beta hydrolase [Pusillimonas sp.]|uniref:alpha/beta hydrolase n=1 Tax=Pusillimonas sp. TaxID=3040095 RepID=UPI0037CAE2DE